MKFKLVLAFIFIYLHSYSQQPTYNWLTNLENDEVIILSDMTIDNIGNIYSVGHFLGTVDFDPGISVLNVYYDYGGMFIQKTDEDGNLIWLKTFETTDDFGNSMFGVATNSLGNVFVTGAFELDFDMNPNSGIDMSTSNGEVNMYIIKLDSTGNYIWGRSYGSSDGSVGNEIASDDNDNVYITGEFHNTIDFDLSAGTNIHTCPNSFRNAFLLKLDSNGDLVWANSHGDLSGDMGVDLGVDNIGNVYVVGVFQGSIDADPGPNIFQLYSNGVQNSVIQKFDPLGNLIWAGSFESNSHVQILDMDIDNNSNIYVTGVYRALTDFDINATQHNLSPTITPNRDCFTVKMDSSGTFKWATTIGDDSSQYQDVCEAIAVDSKGYVYTTGRFYNTVDFDPGTGVFNIYTGVDGESDIYIQKLDSLGNFVWAGVLENNSNNSSAVTIDIGNNDKVYITGEISDTTDMDPTALGYYESIPPPGFKLQFTLCLNDGLSTGLPASIVNKDINHFPNPVKNILQINSDEAISEIMIYDSSGKLTKNIKTDSKTQIQIPLRGLTTGIYLISCVTSKKVVSYKIVIE